MDNTELNDLDQAFDATRAYALSLPEAWEDHPWGEIAMKVRKKVFLFISRPENGGVSMSMKLPSSAEFALLHPFTEPTGYGLGNSGWVTAKFTNETTVPIDMVQEWILQSYCAVAPKKLSEPFKEQR